MPPSEVQETICMWCGKVTDPSSCNREHIFQKTIGGKSTLPTGSVCKDCNNKLSVLDEYAKYGHPSMMLAFQNDPGMKGRIRDKGDRLRKEKESHEINGKGEAKGTRIVSTGSDKYIINADFHVTTNDFVRVLHKDTANVLCASYGSNFVRNNYPDLITFVLDNGDVNLWSYAVSYPIAGKMPLISEPRSVIVMRSNGDCYVCFIHSSGVWITGCKPSTLNPQVISSCDEIIAKMLGAFKDPESQRPCSEFFGFNYIITNARGRTAIGKLRFLWIKKEIPGKPDPDNLQLLTTCAICGQTNPTGKTLPRNILYQGNVNNVVTYPANSWNSYTIDDLRKKGVTGITVNSERFERLKSQGISVPREKDVRMLCITDCRVQCINCGTMITYNASECFV